MDNPASRQEIMGIFEVFYLDKSRKNVRLCMKLTEQEITAQNIQITAFPSYTTFLKYVKTIPKPFIDYFRIGESHEAKTGLAAVNQYLSLKNKSALTL